LRANDVEKVSGCVIDTSGVLDQAVGTDMIRDIVAEFSVSVIVVLGHERLYNDMARRFSGKLGLSVVKLARSGGAVETNDAYLQQLQNYVTKQYFYGELKNVLSPVSRTLDFKTIKVYRLAESTFIDSA
jgi:polyribonucleotide 5'-hydroxyl-kinase